MDRGKRDIAWILGVAASIIAIFVFFTGSQNFGDAWRSFFGSGGTQTSNPVQRTDPTRRVELPTETPLTDSNDALPPTAITMPTQKPAEITLVETGKNYTIELVRSNRTKIEVILKSSGGFPFNSQGFRLKSVVRDITGNWQYQQFQSEIYFQLLSEGTYVATSQVRGDIIAAEPGVSDYILISEGENLGGYWGNTIMPSSGLGPGFHGLVLPVREGMTTRITITLSKLDVGVVNSGGTRAYTDVSVRVFCQGQDMVGKPIPDSTCGAKGGDTHYGNLKKTDSTGKATYYLGPGTYYIEINAGYATREVYVYNVQLSPGEKKQQIVKYEP